MRIFTPIFKKKIASGAKALTIISSLLLLVWQVGTSQTTFTQSNLNLGPGSVDLSTYLQFGPDGRLYVAELYGLIKIYTITKDGPNNYRVTDQETLTNVFSIPNHDDDGSFNSKDERELTSLVVGGTAANPIIYAVSSDPWSGGPGGDVDKDTNSGVITRMTWTGSSWSTIDLVRGLPASEENHASHGLELASINGTNYLILCQGGNTNAGSPSQNFAWTTEYALSAAILAINLDQLDGMSTKTDGSRTYKYDLPTLDDPSRPNVNGIDDPNQAGYNGIDPGDPWGGNDGLNQAKLVPGGPVQILSPGYRNSYDLTITESGALFVTDNGANEGWGGFPENEGLGGNATNNYRVGEPGSSVAENGEGPITNQDHLTLITTDLNSYTFGSFYGGHPNPVRSNPASAGIFTRGPHSSDPGDSNGNSYTDDWFRNTILDVTNPNFETQSLPVDWPPVPISAANPIEGDYRLPGAANPDGPSDDLVTTLLNNSNGIDEYTASGDMKGNLIIGRSNGSLHRIVVDANGNLVSKEQGWVTGLGSDANALGITCNGDNDPFPGTIWVGTFNDKIVVLEPNSGPIECILPGDEGYDAQADNDNDGYTNGDEDANGTDLCSANSKPEDFDDDKVSDLTDLDDDNDGINDDADPFQLGTPFAIPVTNELFNNQSLLQGYKGLGLTGLMNNGDANPNYLNWLDDPDASNSDNDDILGGAIGAVTIYQVGGDANSNNQEKAFQYGVNVDASTGKIIVSSRMLQPFHNFAVGESQGIYIGTGFQDNYIKLILTNGGLEVQGEDNDVALTGLPTASLAIPSSNLDLIFEIDPATGEIQAAYSLNGGTTSTPIGAVFTATGGVLNALQNANTPLAVGIIGTSGSNPEFAASWDFLNVKTEEDTPVGDVVYRVNAGGATLTAIDGGQDWISDIGATLAANGFEVNPETNTAFGPPSAWDPAVGTEIQGTTPFGIFDWERWDIDDPEPDINMTYTFNVGEPGDYKLRLYFRDTYSGTAQPGQRVFNVLVEGNLLPETTNIDISANPGPDLATVIEVDVTIADTDLLVEFVRNQQSPLISGIEILKGGSTGVAIQVQDVPDQTNIEGDNANITVVASGGDGDLDFSATGLPPGVSIDPTNGLIGGTIDPGAAINSPYTVVVSVDDDDEFNSDAKTVSFQWTITAPGQNNPPSAAFTATPTTGTAPLAVSFDASASSDPDQDDILSYSWAFGDGGTATGVTTNHNYISDGVYTVTLTVSDGEDNATATEVITVGTVNNGQPSFRVNAGGETLTAVDGGLDWISDIDATLAVNGFEVTGETNTAFGPPPGWDPAIGADIQNATPFDIFDWERWDADDPEPEINMTYTFNMGNPGTYTVRLFFRETFSGTSQPGQRQFTVTLDGNNYPALTNIDLAANPGPDLATVIEQEVTILDNLLEVVFIRNIQSPMISGLEILQQGGGEIPIVLQAISNQSNEEGEVVSLGVQASGGDGTLSYQASGLPTGLGIDSGTGLITGTIGAGAAVSSPFNVQITVDDNDANNADAQVINFEWEVTAPQVNTPPVASFTATPTSGTAPLLVAFDASASSDADVDDILSFSWDFGDGSNGTGETPNHTYSTPGEYTVTLTVSDGEDSATATTTITVTGPNQPPVAAFVTDAIEGTAPLVVNFDAVISSDPDGDPLTYSWDFGDGNVGTGVTFTHTYTTSGFYTAVLTVSDGQASSQTSIGIRVDSPNSAPLLAFSANPTTGTAPLEVNFDASATIDQEDDPLTFNWTFGDGTSGTGATITHTFENVGVYTVALLVSDGDLTSQGSINITVEDGGCQEVVIDSEDFESGYGIWNDAGSDARRNSADAVYANSGIYCIRLRDNSTTSFITSDALDLSNADEISVGLSFLPISMENQTEDFWLQIARDGVSFETMRDWNAGIDFQNGERINEVVQIAGPFTANTKIRLRLDASSNSDWVYIDDVVITACNSAGNQNQAPIAQFQATPLIGPAPLDVSFNASQSSDPDGDPLTYTWDFGDGNTGTGVAPDHTYQSTGVFTVKLTVSDGQSSTNAFVSVFVSSGNTAPIASFTATPTSGTSPLLVNFDASGSSDPDNDPLSYTWTFGDGASGSGISPSHTYQNGGVYTATLTVSDGSASTSSTTTITVIAPNQGPTAAFTATPTTGEAPLVVSFDASTSSDPENDPLTYSWAFGDGNNGTGVSPNHTYLNPGSYTVTLTVSDGEFSDQATTLISVLVPNLGPTAAFTATPTAGEAPLAVSFDASTSSDPENDPLSYSWDFGDGNTGTGVSPSHTYLAGGVFTVTLTVSDGQSSDQVTTTITVNPGNQAPTALFITSATTGPAPLTVSFDAGLSSDPDDDPLSYSWTFGDGGTASTLTASHIFNLPGTYLVILTVSDGELSDQASISIEVTSGNVGPTAAFTATPSSGTVPLIVSFDASTSSDPENDPLTYSWAFGDGETANGVTSSHEYVAAGSYTVTLTVSDGEFSSTANATITVDGDGCNVVEIDAEDFETGWGIWNDGGSDARRATNDAAFANSGIYTVRLRDNSSSSHTRTDPLDLSNFEEITVDFSFITLSMDNITENFTLAVSFNGGASFTTVGRWRESVEFENEIRYFEQVNIPGPFTASTILQFECDASTNSDWVYLDDIVITGCTTGGTSGLVVSNESSLNLAPSAVTEFSGTEDTLKEKRFGELAEVVVFPNPTRNEINIKNLPADATIQLFDLNGRLLEDRKYVDRLDLTRYSTGVYILSVRTEKAIRRIKVVKD